MEQGPQLEVTLTAETKLLGSSDWTAGAALAFDKHRQLQGHLVVDTY
jgi:hypothetical protein